MAASSSEQKTYSPHVNPNRETRTGVGHLLMSNRGQQTQAGTVAESQPVAASSVPEKKLPITVLSGFLGAGKTTLLTNILTNVDNLKIAVIVNDMAELNIDAQVVQGTMSVLQREERLVSMQNGCICCTLREDLMIEVAKLAKEQRFDYLVIESTGISEPMQVAETFTFQTPEMRPLADLATLDTLVTVVDLVNFPKDVFAPEDETVGKKYFGAGQRGGDDEEDDSDASDDSEEGDDDDNEEGEDDDDGDDKPAQGTEEDERHISLLYLDQVEFANVIILNKVDLVDEATVDTVEQLMRRLNPAAKILRSTRSNVPLTEIMNTQLFSLEKAASTPGWLATTVKGAESKPETEEYGISSFIYRRRRPFHPERLGSLMERLARSTDSENLVYRSKGTAWIATRNAFCIEWSSAGRCFSLNPIAPWVAALPKEILEQEMLVVDEASKQWIADQMKGGEIFDVDESIGDRRQELVFIGHKLNVEQLIKELDAALLSDAEWALPRAEWLSFLDPLTSHWDGEADSDEEEEEEHHSHHHGHKH